MDQTAMEALEAIELYTILPTQADRVFPLLTQEARELIAGEKAFSLCAVEDGEACGAVCARMADGEEDILELVSLYVAPSHRRRGVGITLLLELLDELSDFTGGELRGVRAMFSSSVPGLEQLFQKAGFVLQPMEHALSWRITVEELARSPLLRSAQGEVRQDLMTLGELTDYQKRRVLLELQERDADYLSLQELLEADGQLSTLRFDREERLLACAVVASQGEGTYCLKQFYCAPNHPAAAMGVLRASAGAMERLCRPDDVLEVPTVAAPSAQLVQRLLTGEKGRETMTEAVLLMM